MAGDLPEEHDTVSHDDNPLDDDNLIDETIPFPDAILDAESTSPGSNPNNPVALIKKLYSPPAFHTIPITPAASFPDANHFLRVEHLEEHVQGLMGEQIQKIVREREPELREEVRAVVESYVKNMVKDLMSTDHAIKVAIGDYNG